MNVHLVGADEAVYTEVREILSNIPEVRLTSTLQELDSENGWCGADLHIWNFRHDLVLPHGINWSSLCHIFLVDRNDVAVLRERTGTTEGNILLKPVGPVTLATLFLAAASSGVAESLRADRDAILQCLIQTNWKLQEYDHQRTAFLTRAVSDFGAPLMALSGYCGLLLSEPLGPLNEGQTDVLQRMQNSAKRLSRMASAMYELSTGEDSEKRPDLQPGNICSCIQQTLEEVIPLADEKSIAIAVDVEPCDGLYFEPGQIEHVLLNILDNACRFTPRAGWIEIHGSRFFWERRASGSSGFMGADRRLKTTREPNSYRLDITDSGIPIPEERLASIFEEYTSYTDGCDRSGGGLGLAICKRIISQHHGRIWAENHETGPVFSFILPIHKTDPRFPVPSEFAGSRNNLRGRRDAD